MCVCMYICIYIHFLIPDNVNINNYISYVITIIKLSQLSEISIFKVVLLLLLRQVEAAITH